MMRVNNHDASSPTMANSETKNPSTPVATTTVCQEEKDEHQNCSDTPREAVRVENDSNSNSNIIDDDDNSDDNNINNGNDEDDDNNNDDDSTAATNNMLPSSAQADEDPVTQVVTTALENILEISYHVQDHMTEGGDEPRKMFRFPFTAEVGDFLGRMEIRKQQNFFLLYCTSPILIPENRRAEVADFLCWVNYDLMFGYWEMDMNDGEIRHKIITRSQGMTATEVATLFFSSVFIVNTFFPGIMAVTYAGKSPREAYQDCMAAHASNKKEMQKFEQQQ